MKTFYFLIKEFGTNVPIQVSTSGETYAHAKSKALARGTFIKLLPYGKIKVKKR